MFEIGMLLCMTVVSVLICWAILAVSKYLSENVFTDIKTGIIALLLVVFELIVGLTVLFWVNFIMNGISL